MARQPLRLRIARAFAGTRLKELIPALPPDGGLSLGSASGRVNTYASKYEQLTAKVGMCFTANAAIVDPLSAIPMKLYRTTKGKKEDHRARGPRPHRQSLSAYTGEQMRQLHGTYMKFIGESYILMMDDSGPFQPRKGQLPGALDILPAHRVSFHLGDVYTRSTVTYAATTYPISSFIRDLNPDPDDPSRGRSIVKAAALTLDIENQMKRWNQSTFANGAQPSLVFTSEEPMDDETYERWKQQFDDEHTGTDNAGRPLLIEGGDVKPFMMTARDLDFLKSRQFTQEELLAMWRVSPEIIGSTVNSNRATMDAAFTLHAIINLWGARSRAWAADQR